ncbi:MAG: hypothetical protein ACR2MI_02150 [Flavobacteriaceae bacterium]
MKTTIYDLSAGELFTWVELKDADIQYNLFDLDKQFLNSGISNPMT